MGRCTGSGVSRLVALVCALVCLSATPEAYAQDTTASVPRVWTSGAYSFSDELGGFAITSVSGTGTKSDPVVITEEYTSSSPATLVIRAARPLRPFNGDASFASGFIHLRIVAVNGSGQGWVEFEFELQENYGVPSVFGDGLSFDQRRTGTTHIASTGFSQFSRDFEPYDRLLYTDGHIDPRAVADFSFLITDFTPRLTFFLVQDPRIPMG